MLFVVLFARRDVTAAFAAGDKAIALNKFDMRSVGTYGARLIANGDVDRGLALLAQAEAGGRSCRPSSSFPVSRQLSARRHGARRLPCRPAYRRYISARLDRTRAGGVRQGDQRRRGKRSTGWLRSTPPGATTCAAAVRFFPADFIVDRLARDLTAAGLTKASLSPPSGYCLSICNIYVYWQSLRPLNSEFLTPSGISLHTAGKCPARARRNFHKRQVRDV